MRCQNAARAGPFGGVVPVQMANSSTPAAARRSFMLHIKQTDRLLARLAKERRQADDEEYDEEDEE